MKTGEYIKWCGVCPRYQFFPQYDAYYCADNHFPGTEGCEHHYARRADCASMTGLPETMTKLRENFGEYIRTVQDAQGKAEITAESVKHDVAPEERQIIIHVPAPVRHISITIEYEHKA